MLSAVLIFAFSSMASAEIINEATSVLIARAYVTGLGYQVDGNLEDELYKPSKVNLDSYEFLVQDVSGDCGLTVVVKFDGSIDLDKTKSSCN